jgi:hypothetical protein
MNLLDKEKLEVNGDINLEENNSYQQAGLDSYVDRCYQQMGYSRPTPIQYYALQTYNS